MAKKPARERLRLLRDKHGLSQEALGAKVGCSGAAIVRYESDDPSVNRIPRTPIACAIHKLTKKLGDAIAPLDWCG